MKNLIVTIALFSLFLVGCDLEKVVDSVLPEYPPELSVEWYIEPGKPFKMTLTETVGYFDSARVPIVSGALVVVSYNGISDTLRNGILPDGSRFFNYFSFKTAPSQVGTVFNMYIKDLKGREARATATILPKVQIDSLRAVWDKADTAASLLTTIKDDPAQKNYYRRFINRGSTKPDTSGRRRSDTWFSDQTATDNRVTIGTGFSYKRGDTAIVTFLPLSKEYFDFLNSVDDAQDSNGSPFQQPSVIVSNIKGGVGIFTTLVATQDTIFLKK